MTFDMIDILYSGAAMVVVLTAMMVKVSLDTCKYRR